MATECKEGHMQGKLVLLRLLGHAIVMGLCACVAGCGEGNGRVSSGVAVDGVLLDAAGIPQSGFFVGMKAGSRTRYDFWDTAVVGCTYGGAPEFDSVTDRDGAFHIEGPKCASCTLFARKTAPGTVALAWHEMESGCGSRVVWVLDHTEWIRGQVRGPDGSPLAGAAISLGAMSEAFIRERDALTVTDSGGEYALQISGLDCDTMCASKDGLGAGCEVISVEGNGEHHVDLSLRKPGSIRGKITTTRGLKVEDHVTSIEYDTSGNKMWMYRFGEPDSEGAFTVEGLPPGLCQVRYAWSEANFAFSRELWTKCTIESDRASAISLDCDSQVYLTKSTFASSRGQVRAGILYMEMEASQNKVRESLEGAFTIEDGTGEVRLLKEGRGWLTIGEFRGTSWIWADVFPLSVSEGQMDMESLNAASATARFAVDCDIEACDKDKWNTLEVYRCNDALDAWLERCPAGMRCVSMKDIRGIDSCRVEDLMAGDYRIVVRESAGMGGLRRPDKSEKEMRVTIENKDVKVFIKSGSAS